MKQHLFLFTLGPVQSFISQARKTQDLFGGSRLLSDLCRAGAQHFESAVVGGKVIFPNLDSDSIPNRFLGIITCDETRLASIGEQVQNAVETEWLEKIATPTLEKFGLDAKHTPAIRAQLDNHLDIQWCFQSMESDNEHGYHEAYNILANRLNAQKTVRPFYQYNFGKGEKGRKCSIDGERNVAIYRKTEAQQSRGETEASIQNKLLFAAENRVVEYAKGSGVELRFLQPGEGLSAVSLAKRCYPNFPKGKFESTANIALLDTLINSMHSEAEQKAFNDYAKLFDREADAFSMNGQLYYEDSLTPDYFRKQGITVDLSAAQKQQEGLTDILKSHGRSWDKYYALVVFDGDNMGACWSGRPMSDTKRLQEFHTELAGHLAAFAAHVRAAFEQNQYGKVVYAGGDDFMGLVNLHHLFPVLEMLRDQYRALVHTPMTPKLKPGKQLTFSAGVCVAHYKEPLSLVLDKARKLEKDAKKWPGNPKNNIALGVIPGSGQVAKTILPLERLELIQGVYGKLKDKQFSNAFINKLRMEGASLLGREGSRGEFALLTEQVMPALMNRYIERACNVEGENERKAAVQSLQAQISQLHTSIGFQPLLDALDIADFLERQTRIQQPANPVLA